MIEFDPYRHLVETLELGSDRQALEGPFALARDYARERLGEHAVENAVARLWHGPGGLYYELKAAPDAFYARLGPIFGEYLSQPDAQMVMWDAVLQIERQEADVVALYAPDYLERDESVFLSYTLEGIRYERGEPRYAPPLFLRVEGRIESLVMMQLEPTPTRPASQEYLMFRLPKGQPLLPGLRD
ncbi:MULTISPECIES: hypothetical protein [unclassified Meiothermus]|uniref:hypothetical protein n=1 Tax=unclassified Meiothermus TaxID=370471 RepID=UPI000D7CB46F|nr:MULTISPECIES: hypothetical protein [unclassified Meiothermus]PZA06155.1 hypothetical protein DNA98_14915 [Meiothermus sp. Pnk-1]RYM36205.1 hypothetical protein EWH23_10925 [Meiothermus sp. PNK-Is4]